MNNLQNQNLHQCIQAMAHVPGWEALQEAGFLAVKAPVRESLVNFVWARPDPATLATAKDFFAGRPFIWAQEACQDGQWLLAAGFKPAQDFPDMVFDLQGYVAPALGPAVKVLRADSSLDFPFWAATAAEGLGMEVEVIRDFFQPLVREGGSVPFLVLHEGRPAATAMVFCGTVTGIYAVATRPNYRRLGLGQAAIHACLQWGQQAGTRQAVLSSSVMGLPMYEKMGFRTERIMSEYHSR